MPNMKVRPMTISAMRRKSRRLASDIFASPNGWQLARLLCARREWPRGSGAECDQQFPPFDGDCHTPLPCEVRKGNDTTSRACSLHVRGGRMLVASTSVSGFNYT